MIDRTNRLYNQQNIFIFAPFIMAVVRLIEHLCLRECQQQAIKNVCQVERLCRDIRGEGGKAVAPLKKYCMGCYGLVAIGGECIHKTS